MSVAHVHCREHKDQVSGECSSEIFRRQENAADDFRLDKELYTACQVTSCHTRPPGRGTCCRLLSSASMTCASQQPAACFKLLLKRLFNDQETVLLPPPVSETGLLPRASHHFSGV